MNAKFVGDAYKAETETHMYLEIPQPVKGHWQYELWACGDHHPFELLTCRLNFNSQNVSMSGEFLLSFSMCSDNNMTTFKKLINKKVHTYHPDSIIQLTLEQGGG